MIILNSRSLYSQFDNYDYFRLRPHNAEYLFGQHGRNAVLLLEGGSDVDPAADGDEDSFCNYTSPEMDALETYYIHLALKYNAWIFGICRGLQLVNVAFGGTLWQDLVQDRRTKDHFGGHSVELMGIGCDIYRAPYTRVNSLHHQGIRKLGETLTPIALHADGLIEGIYSQERKVVAVQWHPEIMNDNAILRWIAMQKKD